MHIASTQRPAFQITELVEHKERVVAGTFVVAVPDAQLLLAVGRADARIHIEHDGSAGAASMNTVDPLAGKLDKRREVLLHCQPARLETPHLARRCRRDKSRLATNNPAHRRIMAQALGVVHVFVSGEPTEYRLPQHPDQVMAAVLAGARVREQLTRHRGQPERVVEFTIGKQPSIGSHHRAAKLKHQAAIEIQPKSIRFRFTRWVRHGRLARSKISC